jgi:diguanylate cyclase (GGDEF)-like protein
MPSELQLSGVLSEFARTMVTDFPIQGILDRLVERIVEVMPVTSAGVTLISPGVDPRYVAASDGAALRFEKLQTELGEGPCLAAYHSGTAVTVPDLRVEVRFPVFAPRALGAGLAAVFTFPLWHGERRLGALDLYRDTPGELSEAEMSGAQTLADVAAAYLLNAQARADLLDSSERSRRAALHDALTGLPNRVLVLERLEHAFLRSQRSGRTSAVLLLDLDRFKAVNDAYGHRVGDELLIAVGRRLRTLLRSGDTLGRLSGDEFAILCEDLVAPADAERIAARVVTVLDEPFVLASSEVVVTASIGVALAGPAELDAEQLLHHADRAMYRDKHRRQERGRLSDRRNEHLADQQASLEGDLPGVVERGELGLEYQPIVDTVDGRLIGVEALVRWAHPRRGPVAPAVLIPLAEHAGLIAGIGQWVLDQAWSQRSRWPSRRPAPAERGARAGELAISVNVSAQQLMSVGFAETVAGVLGSSGGDPRLLSLEVTESVFDRDSERALVVLHDLKDIGVTVTLDNFGVGYSSLSYLKRFPVDVVKIDREFVTEVAHDPVTRTIVAAVIRLAHDLRMTVTAEGVETVEQLRELDLLGCDNCQGYYFAPAMSAVDLEALIRPGLDGAPARLPASLGH